MLENRLSAFMAEHIFVELCFFVCCNKLDLSASRVHESLYLSLICAELECIFPHSQSCWSYVWSELQLSFQASLLINGKELYIWVQI